MIIEFLFFFVERDFLPEFSRMRISAHFWSDVLEQLWTLPLFMRPLCQYFFLTRTFPLSPPNFSAHVLGNVFLGRADPSYCLSYEMLLVFPSDRDTAFLLIGLFGEDHLNPLKIDCWRLFPFGQDLLGSSVLAAPFPANGFLPDRMQILPRLFDCILSKRS